MHGNEVIAEMNRLDNANAETDEILELAIRGNVNQLLEEFDFDTEKVSEVIRNSITHRALDELANNNTDVYIQINAAMRAVIFLFDQ